MASMNLAFEVSAIVFLIGVALQVSSKPHGNSEMQRSLIGIPGKIYSFPYLCTVVFGARKAIHFVSTCTIVQRKFAVASLDNLRANVSDTVKIHGVKYWFNVVRNLHVLSGPYQLYPNVAKDWYEKDHPVVHDKNNPNDRFADVSRVTNLHIPILERIDSENITSVRKNLNDFSDLLFDAYGVALNIGLLETVGFVWSVYTLPIPFQSLDKHILRRQEWDHINSLEYFSYSQTSCVVGVWKQPYFTISYHQVIYIPKQQCKESYCAHDIRSCMKYPDNPNQVCFKSILFSDLCPSDRGAALYCDGFGKSVFAILTTALNCGQQNLPCVYTLASKVVEMVGKVQGRMDPPIDYSKYVLKQTYDYGA